MLRPSTPVSRIRDRTLVNHARSLNALLHSTWSSILLIPVNSATVIHPFCLNCFNLDCHSRLYTLLSTDQQGPRSEFYATASTALAFHRATVEKVYARRDEVRRGPGSCWAVCSAWANGRTAKIEIFGGQQLPARSDLLAGYRSDSVAPSSDFSAG